VEGPSYGIVDKCLLVDWLVTRIVPKHGLFVPLTFHLVASSWSRVRLRLIHLRIEKWVPVQNFFLLSALDLLHFGEFLQALFLLSFLLELLVLSHKLLGIIRLARVVLIAI